MTSTASRYFLFPRLLLADNELSNLFFLFPRLSFLQVIRPPFLPHWAEERFSGWSAIEDPDLREAITHHWKGYQEFAQLHGEDSIMASMAQDWVKRNSAETRLDIQSKLKGKDAGGREVERALWLLEAGVFMEIARDLEEKELELETGYAEAGNLEAEFREILGVENIDELEDSMGALSPPLLPERTASSFMLLQRTMFWFRLFFSRAPEEAPVFVTLGGEAMEEILEALEKENKRTGCSPDVLQIPLFSFPNLNSVPVESFLKWMKEMERSGLLQAYGQSLQDVLNAPLDGDLQGPLASRVGELRRHAVSLLNASQIVHEGEFTLTLTVFETLTHEDLARCLDRQSLEKSLEPKLPTSMPKFLSLREANG